MTDVLKREWYTAEEVKSMGGLGVFTWIAKRPPFVPVEVWEQTCQCVGSSKEFKGWAYDDTRNLWVHVGCGKPKPTFAVLFECDNCEHWFLTSNFPERTFVCEPCKVANA